MNMTFADKLSGKGRTLCADMEAVGLLPDIRAGHREDMHVIVCKDAKTKEVFVFFDEYEQRINKVWLDDWEGEQDGSLLDGIQFLNECDKLIMQNFVGYDHLAFGKVFPDEYTVKVDHLKIKDTLVMSRLLNPERRPPKEAFALGRGNVGPHSIEAHGIRIGRYKPENEDWSHLTDHMVHRCIEDVEIGLDFYYWLRAEWTEQSTPNPYTKLGIMDAYKLELFMQWQMSVQEQLGFRLDMNLALRLVNELDEQVDFIVANAVPHLPLRIKKKKLNHEKMQKAAEKAGQEHLVTHTHGSDRAVNWNFVTKKGTYSANTTKDYPECVGNISDHMEPLVCGPYTPISYERVTLGNRDVVRQTLYDLGWRGVNYTDSELEYIDEHQKIPYHYAGKLDSDSIERWSENHEPPQWALDILKYYILTHRRGQILNRKDCEYYKLNGHFPKQASGRRECKGLVARARLEGDGTEMSTLMDKYGIEFFTDKQWTDDEIWSIPAQAISLGTNTHRMRHKYVVNIPSRGLYGKEMRQLFIARGGYKILGCDASGLELRMLSHFMQDSEYQDIILNGDIHTYNQDKAGLPIRDMAKTFIYAFLYGSGIEGLAAVCGVSTKQMSKMVAQFLAELPLLKALIDNVTKAGEKKGYMKAVDGRWGRIRKGKNRKIKVHTVLNVLLQMTGSLVMKWAYFFAYEEFMKLGIEPRMLANVHDEVQMEIPEIEVEHHEYWIKKGEWKVEEKQPRKNKDGHYYSAPTILKETEDSFLIGRTYHAAGDVLARAFERTQEHLRIRCPLAGEYMIGNNWGDTH